MMDILLDPNVAYLILLGGVLLGFLAIVTPGTGMLEVGTFFCILLTSYAVYRLSVNGWAIVVMLLSLIPFVYASRKPRRELYLGLSILIVVIGSIFVFPRSETQAGVNPLVAIFSTSFMAIFLWLAVRKSIEAAHLKPLHDLNELVGKSGTTRTAVSSEGSVQVAGELWSARSDQLIPVGSAVKVVRREGFILVVERLNSTQS
jgi:membrane-bound serine protease (ClpP class)